MTSSHFARSGQVFSRIVLPLVLFVGVIGGTAWVLQNLGSWTANTTQDPTDPTKNNPNVVEPAPQAQGPPLAKFEMTKSLWKAKNPELPREFEQGTDGHFDYPFDNVSEKDLDMGLLETSCDCQRMELAIGDKKADVDKLTWNKLIRSDKDKDGVLIPAGAHGYFRVNFATRQKAPGTPLNLRVKVWYQVSGKASTRQYETLETRGKIAKPLNFVPETEKVEVADTTQVTFDAWSATRENIDVLVKESSRHPNFSYDVKPMSDEERSKFEAKMVESKILSRVTSAFKITVTITEDKDGKMLDQGLFNRTLDLEIKQRDDPKAEVVDVAGPTMLISVRSDVEVANEEQRGRITLKTFKLKMGTAEDFFLTAPLKTDLKVDSVTPDYLQVTLKKNEKGPNAMIDYWTLKIVVQPERLVGTLPPGAAIVLQVTPNRKIRIPVSGASTP